MDLRDYLAVLNRRRWSIILAVLVVVGTAMAASFLQTPVYEGQARLLLERNPSPFEATAQRVDPAFVETEIQVIKSEPVRQMARERLGFDPPGVAAFAVGETTVVEVRAESTKPAQAAENTNAFAEAYIEYRRTQAIDSLLAAAAEIQGKVNTLQADVDELSNRIAALPPCVPTENSPSCGERDSLQKDRDAKVTALVPFRQKLDQLQVDTALKTGGAQLIRRAATPRDPVRPKPIRNGVLALGFGAVLGVALAFLFEHLDDTIKTKQDVERAVPGHSVLALIPPVAGWKDRSDVRLVSLTEPSSPAAESYRSLRTSISFMGLDKSLRILEVTSANTSEGKTTTVANLAVVLARAGQRVLVIDCDLRRPRTHEFFDIPNGVGLTSVILGESPLSGAVQKVAGEGDLRVLTCGPLPPNPSELLSSQRMGQLLSGLKSQADIVLLDCPPLLPVTDAALLSRWVDGTLLVVSAGSTTRGDLTRAVELLRQVEAPMIGTVLNGVQWEGGYGYAYYYNHGGKRSRSEPASGVAPARQSG